jgi:hypothetical protein
MTKAGRRADIEGMPSTPFLHRGRRWAVAALLVAMVSHPAFAEFAPAAGRDTVTPYIGRWRDELPKLFAQIATTLDSGFAAPERNLVLREMRAIRPYHIPGQYGPNPYKLYQVQVRFRGRESEFTIHAYWPDTVRVAFHLRSRDTLLTNAIDSTIRAARVALLSAPTEVRIRLEDSQVWTGAVPGMVLAIEIDEAPHCPGFGLESRGEVHGDTLAIHVDGAAPKDTCPYAYWTPPMAYWREVAPGRYHVAIDYKADTNRFVALVSDTSFALSTIRSTFVTADERIRWRVPSGSFVLTCARSLTVNRATCDVLREWAARRPGVQGITFDSTGVSPFRDALAYRYADDDVLARTRACISTIKPGLRRGASVELQILPRSGAWVVDRIDDPRTATKVPEDPSCGLPSSIVNPARTFATYPLNCPTPTKYVRRVVASVLRRSEGTPEWLREHGVAVPTAETLQPLSGAGDVTRCRHIDSTSLRHPVYVFRAGRYFVATSVDATGADVVLDGSPALRLVWVLDSAGEVVYTPRYQSLVELLKPRGANGR